MPRKPKKQIEQEGNEPEEEAKRAEGGKTKSRGKRKVTVDVMETLDIPPAEEAGEVTDSAMVGTGPFWGKAGKGEFSELVRHATEAALSNTEPGMVESVEVVGRRVGRGARKYGWRLAGSLLAEREISPESAARLILEALEESDDVRLASETDVHRVRQIIRMGVENYRQMQNTVPFSSLVDLVLYRKCYRRVRTLQEILQFTRRMIRVKPEWRLKPVRSATPQECRELIETTYPSLVMRHKARTLLHGLFAYALKQGWCATNPMEQVDFPPNRERRIYALGIRQVRNLLSACLLPEHLPCAPALGLLMWAGIRPNEMERLRWRNVNLKERIITIPPEHSKTGGARQVTMQPVLKNWLAKTSPYRIPDSYVVPPSWGKRWRLLRKAAGLVDWDADVLRHTFASYHLRRFRNLQELQVDMGHGSTDLLRTRYLNMEGVTAEAAKQFWTMDVESLKPRKSRGEDL